MNANAILKSTLVDFWHRFGGRKNNGVGFTERDKLTALIELSQLTIRYVKQQPISIRRGQFDTTKHKLHPWQRFGGCFVCGAIATDRHHIVQLQNGGINSKKNLVSLCGECHCKIHPWLSA